MGGYLKMVREINNRYNDSVVKFCSSFSRYLNLNHFWHYRLTHDGYISSIGTHAEWMELFAAEKFFLIYPQHRHPRFIQQHMQIIKGGQDQPIKKIVELGSKFGMKQSLVIINKTAGGVEEFGFTSGDVSDDQTSHFLNELPLIRHFIGKFKEQNRNLLSKLDEHRINLADLLGSAFYQDHSPNLRCNDRHSLLKNMGIEKESLLSSRELQVMRLILLGLSASKIAPQIYLSKRTVEHHIERIKEKLRCDSKSELIQKARELELLGSL